MALASIFFGVSGIVLGLISAGYLIWVWVKHYRRAQKLKKWWQLYDALMEGKTFKCNELRTFSNWESPECQPSRQEDDEFQIKFQEALFKRRPPQC